MIKPTAIRLLIAALLASTLFISEGWATVTLTFDDEISVAREVVQEREFNEPWNAGWSLNLDNDLFAHKEEDRDYTGGFSVTLNGKRAKEFAVSVDPVLTWLNQKAHFDAFSQSRALYERTHALQFGVILFTPDDTLATEPMQDDRPYASLAFLSNAQYALHPDRTTAYQSTLTVGLLGSPLGEWLQKGIHQVSGGTDPRGYHNQISDGGEPTARYVIARHSLLSSGLGDRHSYDLKLSIEGSAGYLTEANAGLAIRWGRITTPWWSSTSDLADYAAQPAPAPPQYNRSSQARELYFWAGIKLRARAYNAFLQGQFRDSAVEFSSSQLNHLLAEAAFGLSTEIGGLRVSYALRFQTNEIKRGRGARDLAWAGVTVSKHF